jgi:hypothetical protein
MVTAFQRQQSSARLFYLRLHLCPHLGHRAGNGTRNSSSCGPFKVQVGEYGVIQDFAFSCERCLASTPQRTCFLLLTVIQLTSHDSQG